MGRIQIALALLGAPWVSGQAWAQTPPERPSEADLFGAPPAPAAHPEASPTPAEAASPALPAPPASDARDQAVLGGGASSDMGASAAPQNPLTIGGQFYLRTMASARQGREPGDYALSSPNLADGYFDARPNDRVRGMLRARMRFDPTVDTSATGTFGQAAASGAPRVLLDQFWLSFDLARKVFVTAGRQHVRWGTGRFFQPTDYLHLLRRDPLAVFDDRLGTTMLRAQVPLEKVGGNLHAVAMLDGTRPANELGRVMGAARAEIALGTGEVGASVVGGRDDKARFGFDASAGLWDFDVYVDAGFRAGSEVSLWRKTGVDIDLGQPLEPQFETYTRSGYRPQVAGGLTWSARYNENDVLTVGTEAFYNDLGYRDAELYPWLIFKGAYQPFYLGRAYGSIFASLPAPYSWDRSSFTLSAIGNASDGTFIGRFDFTQTVLTHLRFELFVAGYAGNRGGEFRFGLDIPAQTIGTQMVPAINLPPPLFDVGLALRLSV